MVDDRSMAPDVEDFRALARSSPWLWRSVRFTLHWDGSPHREGLRAWVRRPDALRVETLTGELVQAGVESWQGSRAMLVSTVVQTDGPATAQPSQVQLDGPVPAPQASQVQPDAGPRFRPAGLRATPRQLADCYDHDAPMFQNYYWVALLDPWELTDGDDNGVPQPGTTVSDLDVVDHHGRPAWQAALRPTDAYDPRCSCCELLPNPGLHARERENGGIAPDHPEGYTYGEGFRVRLDVGTGICVRLEQVGGTDAGRRHELVIEAVDETMDDDLFAAPPRRWRERLGRWVQGRPPRGMPRGWAPYG